MKISTRLLLLFLLLSVLPLALFGYFNLQQSEVMLRSAGLNDLSNLADKKAVQIKSFLTEREREIRIWARSAQVIEAITNLPKLYETGQHTTGYAQENAKLHQYFERFIEEYGLFNDIFLITPQGEIIFSQRHDSDFATNLFSGTYRDTQLALAFRAVGMTLEPVISGYEIYAPSQSPALFIAAPIMVNGKYKGVFAAQLGNELLLRVATDATGLGVSGEAVFAQQFSVKDKDKVLFTMPLKYRDDAAMKLRIDRQESGVVQMFVAVSGESGAGVRTDYRGKEVAAAWRYLPELDWGMVVKIDTDEVFAPMYKQLLFTLEVLAVLLLSIGLVAYFFGQKISSPITQLAETAGEVADGNFNKRADELAFGELGLFARAFNRMSDKLQGLYRSLEQRIEERTLELNVSNAQLHKEIIEREHIEKSLRKSQTQAQHALVELQHNQEILNHAQRIGQFGSWELDCVNGVLRWSDEIYRIFELAPTRTLPSYENFLNIVHPDDRVMVNQANKQSLEDRKPYDMVHRLLLEDGRIKWVRAHCNSEFDASGKPLRSVGAVQDITEQYLAEEQLRIAAATFETHEAIMITDANANIIRVNQAFLDITGYTSEEVLGKNPRILNSGRQDKAFYAAMWQQLLNTGSWTGEMWDRRKCGKIYPKWITLTAVKDKQGKTTEYVAIFSDITMRKQAEEEIHNLAFYDALTGLPNRRLLLERFRCALLVSTRSNRYGAVLFLDMDRFKTLNDTLGHDYGDLLLIEVARRIELCIREVDTVARLGGDEFVVLLDEIDAVAEQASQKVALIAEKIRATLALPYQLKEHEHLSSPSIGVCLYCGNEESVDTLLKHADLAMYQAKDSGRNAVRFFDPAMQLAVETRAALEADLRHAVANKQLRLFYQIQLDNDHHVMGAEALVRWIHPKRGMISPVQFIPIAEESSLILDIGNWVLETACQQLALWSKCAQTQHLKLAVNVSAQQFRKHDFVDTVIAMIHAHHVNPACLKLELTESVVLTDVADIVAKMHALKALGIKLALDDFGTGYSSLSYLKQLPLDQLKIDKSFVRNISTDPKDAMMVQTIINLAQNFHLNVIAEGVETETQLEFLKHNGCMAYQGFLFSKPVPIKDFEALVNHLCV